MTSIASTASSDTLKGCVRSFQYLPEGRGLCLSCHWRAVLAESLSEAASEAAGTIISKAIRSRMAAFADTKRAVFHLHDLRINTQAGSSDIGSRAPHLPQVSVVELESFLLHFCAHTSCQSLLKLVRCCFEVFCAPLQTALKYVQVCQTAGCEPNLAKLTAEHSPYSPVLCCQWQVGPQRLQPAEAALKEHLVQHQGALPVVYCFQQQQCLGPGAAVLA